MLHISDYYEGKNTIQLYQMLFLIVGEQSGPYLTWIYVVIKIIVRVELRLFALDLQSELKV